MKQYEFVCVEEKILDSCKFKLAYEPSGEIKMTRYSNDCNILNESIYYRYKAGYPFVILLPEDWIGDRVSAKYIAKSFSND